MHQPRQQIVDWAGFGNFERRIPPGGPFSPLSSHLRFKCRHSPSVFIRVHPWFEHPRFRSCPPQPQRRRTFPSIRGRADKKFIQNPPPGPVFFISGFFQAAYKYFNNFGPWTAVVQGPPLNSCVMTVVMTTLAGRPVANRAGNGLCPATRLRFARIGAINDIDAFSCKSPSRHPLSTLNNPQPAGVLIVNNLTKYRINQLTMPPQS